MNIKNGSKEIKFPNYHIIIEAKVGKNSVGKEQNEKYKDCFDLGATNKILCFITEGLSPNRNLKLFAKKYSELENEQEDIIKKMGKRSEWLRFLRRKQLLFFR